MATENVLDATRRCLTNTPRDSGGHVEGHVTQIHSNHLVFTRACLTGALSPSSPFSGKSVQHCTTMCYYVITIIAIIDIYDV